MSVIIATIIDGNKVCITSDTQINDRRDPNDVRRLSGYRKVHLLASGKHAIGFVGSVPVGEQVMQRILFRPASLTTTDLLVEEIKEAQRLVLSSMLQPNEYDAGQRLNNFFVAGIDFGRAFIRVFNSQQDFRFDSNGQVAYLLPPNYAPTVAKDEFSRILSRCGGQVMPAQECFIREYVSKRDASVNDQPTSILLQ